MQFVTQLDPLPSDWCSLEAKVLRTLIRGPYQWILPLDLKSLKRHFAFPAEIHDLRVVEQKAAKVRVSLREAEAAGGLRVEERARRLEQLIVDSDEDTILGRFYPWFKSSRCRLRDALEEARGWGVTLARVDEALAQGVPRHWPRKVARRGKKGTQTFCREQLALLFCTRMAG